MYKTFEEWNSLGYRVIGGEKSHRRNAGNVCLFGSRQVHIVSTIRSKIVDTENTKPFPKIMKYVGNQKGLKCVVLFLNNQGLGFAIQDNRGEDTKRIKNSWNMKVFADI